MIEIKKYLGYTAVILTALLLGRWYAKERDKLLRQGEPWIKSWVTTPGMAILFILAMLIFIKVKFG